MSASLETHRAWLTASILLLLGWGALNVFLPLFIVPKFQVIYQVALPGRSLPGMTSLLIAARLPLALVALAWPVAGLLAARRQQRAATWIINLGHLYFFLLTWATAVALFLPMIGGGGIIVGLSDPASAASSH